jgi:hypothetical protein
MATRFIGLLPHAEPALARGWGVRKFCRRLAAAADALSPAIRVWRPEGGRGAANPGQVGVTAQVINSCSPCENGDTERRNVKLRDALQNRETSHALREGLLRIGRWGRRISGSPARSSGSRGAANPRLLDHAVLARGY